MHSATLKITNLYQERKHIVCSSDWHGTDKRVTQWIDNEETHAPNKNYIFGKIHIFMIAIDKIDNNKKQWSTFFQRSRSKVPKTTPKLYTNIIFMILCSRGVHMCVYTKHNTTL